MNRWCFTSLLCLTAMALMAGFTRADIPSPYRIRERDRERERERERYAPVKKAPELVLKIDGKGDQATLQIPQKMLNGVPVTNGKTSDAGGPGRTVFAGLAMSLSLGGVFLLRRNKRLPRSALALVLICLVGLATGSVVWAANGLPATTSNTDATALDVTLPVGPTIQLPVKIEVMSDGDAIILTVPQNVLERNTPVRVPAPPSPVPEPPKA